MPNVLIVDDNPAVCAALDVLLSLRDIATTSVHTPACALKALEQGEFDLVIQDMNFESHTTSGIEGEELFAKVRNQFPGLPIILLTAWTHLEAAVSLVKSGAADYMAKPWDDDKLLTTVTNLLELGQKSRALETLQTRTQARQDELRSKYDLRGLIFRDPAMEQVIAMAGRFARSDFPVLIRGPNGGGKEKLAEIIHANSPVSQGPWIAVNCGAIPSELLEAELFGAEAGAYTGAHKARVGKFEAAHQGTLFLDEIGTLSLEGQVKLLRVLETGSFSPLGSNRTVEVKVRVVSATNACLESMMRSGEFREDLYYRINTLELEVPPLSHRPEDIPALAQHFLQGRKALSTAAVSALQAHAWPGNVRELRNIIERAALLSPEPTLGPSDLRLDPPRPKGLTRNDTGEDAIRAALTRCNGVVTKAALELGMSRQALYRRMDKLGIPRKGV